MKPEDQIKAIAELDGWTDIKYYPHPIDETWKQLYAGIAPDKKILQTIPPYLTSRDAIVPVIEKLPRDLIVKFIHFLTLDVLKICPIVGSDEACFMASELDCFAIVKATPTQLVEALLRVTGKWIE